MKRFLANKIAMKNFHDLTPPPFYNNIFQRFVFRVDEESDEGAASSASVDRSSVSDHTNSHGRVASVLVLVQMFLISLWFTDTTTIDQLSFKWSNLKISLSFSYKSHPLKFGSAIFVTKNKAILQCYLKRYFHISIYVLWNLDYTLLWEVDAGSYKTVFLLFFL